MGVMADISGSCNERFDRVKDALAACFDQHGDVGASAAVVLQISTLEPRRNTTIGLHR